MNERARFYLIWAWRAQLGPPEWGRKDMGWGWPGDTVCVCAAEWRHILGMLATGARRVSESGGGREQMGPESGHAKRPPPSRWNKANEPEWRPRQGGRPTRLRAGPRAAPDWPYEFIIGHLGVGARQRQLFAS